MPRNAGSSPAPVASGGDISVNEGVDAPPRKRILYLCLEFALWQHARKLAYPAGLGLEEGFDPREIECVTLPSICGLSKAAREAWQSAIQARCAGQRFDQVWFELVHSEWDEGFLGWLASLAPVRVGLIMESLRYEPDVYAQAPHLLNRHAHVEKRLRHATHAVCIDEADAEELQQRGQPALWWPQAVPARFMTPFSDEGPDRRGVFLGSVYGGRGGWLAHPDLLGCLTTMTQAPEDSTSLPAWFDEMQRQWETLLLAGPAFCQDGLPAYMETWRRIRSDCFRGWIQALRGCGSVVNLPSYVRGYAGRVYEAMAAGRPAVSWEIPDRPRSRALFREGEEILHFQRDNPSSLSEALGRLQSDPVFARSVAERGADSVRRHHTVERRVEQVMRWIDSNETPDFTSAAHTATAARPARLLALDPPRTPQTASLTAILGRMRQAQGDSLQASEAFDAALTARASDASLWLARAAAARDQSDLRAFRAAWESAVKCGAGDPAVCRDLCDVCAEHGHRDLAARLSDRLFNHSPEDLGIVVDYLRHRRQGAASRRTPTEWVLDRSWMEALAAQVEAAFDKEEANTATSMAQRVIQVGDLAEARALMEAGKRAEAWTKAQEAILARPFHPAGWLLLSAIALQSGETLRARQCAQEALRLAPKWKEAKSWLAAIPKKPAVPSGSLPELNPGLLGRGVRLTVCVIARNEEKFLARCLASARPIAQQIIVVDTGSTDRTVEIAREAGAEVHGFQWCDDFSAARNAALERARGDWVLQLDADEELVEETRDRLRAATQDASMLAYRLPLADVGKEKEGFHHVPRLFRNAPGVHYKGRVHEHAFGSLEPMQKEWGLQNGIGKVQILHHGYVDQVVKDRSKVQRNLRLLERAIEENPEDASLLMSFGLDLVRSGQMDAGLEEYAKAFRSMSRRPVDATPPELRERLLTLMCSHMITAQRFQTVIEVSETPQASAAGPTASLHMLFGLAHFVQQNYASAASHLKQCVAKRQRPTLSPLLPDTLSGAPRHLLALSYDKLGEKAEAEKQFTASLAETPEATNVRMDFAKHLQREAKRVQALEQLHAIIAQKPSELMAWRMGAEIALRDAAFLDFAVDWTAEAIKAFPRDQTLAAARGEALMLRGAFGDAAPFWDQARADQNPRHDAAFLFCRLQVSPASLGETRAPGAEARISQEFCDWFRAVVSSGNESAIRNLSSRLDALRPVLPTAASRIESVLKEAQAA
ncbi:MAG: glycosyltransferase [Verrucomicrobia bacterium]|nr:glycosyltransferase [Verrucomicrobiota bacterium]